MKDREAPQPNDEPVIISFEAAREALARPDDNPPEPNDSGDPKAEEAFWAGRRNHAMRRSARWAA